jgi:hypothetical protein
MKDIDIHNGLPEKELRDYFSKEIVRSVVTDFHNKKGVPKYDAEDPLKWSIEDAEADIKYHQKRLEILKHRYAVHTLIKERGWQEFDVSDHVANQYSMELRMNFIGTEDEYNNFMKTLENGK